MEDSTVRRVAEGASAIEVEADMAWRLSWLTGKAALEGLGVIGESAGLDMPSNELGEAIVVKGYCIERRRRVSYRIWGWRGGAREYHGAVASAVAGMASGSRDGGGSSGSVSSQFRCTCMMHYVLAGATSAPLTIDPAADVDADALSCGRMFRMKKERTYQV